MPTQLVDLPARTFQHQAGLPSLQGWVSRPPVGSSGRMYSASFTWSEVRDPSTGCWSLPAQRPPPSRSPSHCPIFLCSLAMRSSSWPGPSGKARKRSRSGWRGCADRSRRTWSWPSPSARLTCRPRVQGKPLPSVCTHPCSERARCKPCLPQPPQLRTSWPPGLGFRALFRGSRRSSPVSGPGRQL